MRGIDGHRDWTHVCNRICQRNLVVFIDHHKPTAVGANVSTLETTGLVLSNVGIAFLRVNTVVSLDVFKGPEWPPTVATLISFSLGAVDKVLLTQGDQSPCHESMLSLQTSSGAEGPAGAALALVLDRSDDTLRTPVHFIRDGGAWGSGVTLHARIHSGVADEPGQLLGELGGVQIGVFVDGEIEAEAVGQVLVVLVHVLLVGLPDGVAAELGYPIGRVALVVFLQNKSAL